MKQSIRLQWSNLKVGALLMIVAAILLWASLTGGGTSIFEPKQNFVCYFRNVNGLVRGSPVWMAGMEVGNVRSLQFVNIDSMRQVKVVCGVKKAIWPQLTFKAEVMLGSIGLVGDKYVEIIPGTDSGFTIEPMGVIKTRDYGSIEALYKTAEEAIGNAGNIIGNIDTVLARMNRGEGTLGRIATEDELYVQLHALAANLTVLTADLQKNQERIVSSIERLSHSIADLSGQVTENSGTLGRIMNDPALYDNLQNTTARLDTIMGRISASEGSLGLLVSDTALYVELTNLMVRVKSLVTDIEENPRKYFKFSFF